MLRWTARILLLIITIFWGVFALLSGASEYGGGITGIIKNSPNALPWLVLLIINYLAWKRELIGGIIVLSIALFFSFFFRIWTRGNVFVIVAIFVPLALSGVLFITNFLLLRKKQTTV